MQRRHLVRDAVRHIGPSRRPGVRTHHHTTVKFARHKGRAGADGRGEVNGIGGVLAGSVLQVNPNPVQAGEALVLNFSGGSLSGAEVRWMDLTGRILDRARWAGASRFVLGTDGRAAGSYLIQVVQATPGGDILHTRRVTVR